MLRRLMALTLATAITSGAQAATVLSVTDGDTVTVQEGGKSESVRLACIDAPEHAQNPYGAQATATLRSHLPIGTEVELRGKKNGGWGRTAAEVLRGGTNINQLLVAEGKAFVYWQYIGGCDGQTYNRLETEARSRQQGIWTNPNGITRPWNYRRGR